MEEDFPPKPPEGDDAEELKKMVAFLQSEIVRKDALIAKLQEENFLIMKTALRRADERQKLADAVGKLKDAEGHPGPPR